MPAGLAAAEPALQVRIGLRPPSAPWRAVVDGAVLTLTRNSVRDQNMCELDAAGLAGTAARWRARCASSQRGGRCCRGAAGADNRQAQQAHRNSSTSASAAVIRRGAVEAEALNIHWAPVWKEKAAGGGAGWCGMCSAANRGERSASGRARAAAPSPAGASYCGRPPTYRDGHAYDHEHVGRGGPTIRPATASATVLQRA